MIFFPKLHPHLQVQPIKQSWIVCLQQGTAEPFPVQATGKVQLRAMVQHIVSQQFKHIAAGFYHQLCNISLPLGDNQAQVFKMYGGPAVDITVEFNDKLIGVIQDKFGEDTKIVRTGRDKCVASIRVQISPVFWGWIFQFVGEMTIVSPEGLRE